MTFNGVLLRLWCFPRLLSRTGFDGRLKSPRGTAGSAGLGALVSRRPLARLEAGALMACGAVSTTCWLMAGFYGVARTLAPWPPEHQLLLWAALALALPVAMLLSGRLGEGRLARLQGRRVRHFLDTELDASDATGLVHGFEAQQH